MHRHGHWRYKVAPRHGFPTQSNTAYCHCGKGGTPARNAISRSMTLLTSSDAPY